VTLAFQLAVRPFDLGNSPPLPVGDHCVEQRVATAEVPVEAARRSAAAPRHLFDTDGMNAAALKGQETVDDPVVASPPPALLEIRALGQGEGIRVIGVGSRRIGFFAASK
jgi:hypothetical protein